MSERKLGQIVQPSSSEKSENYTVYLTSNWSVAFKLDTDPKLSEVSFEI